MQITINGQDVNVPDDCLVADVLSHTNETSSTGIAIAINDVVTPKSLWAKTSIKDGDKILIIKASQGG